MTTENINISKNDLYELLYEVDKLISNDNTNINENDYNLITYLINNLFENENDLMDFF